MKMTTSLHVKIKNVWSYTATTCTCSWRVFRVASVRNPENQYDKSFKGKLRHWFEINKGK